MSILKTSIIFMTSLFIFIAIYFYLAPVETVPDSSVGTPNTQWFGNLDSNSMHDLPALPEPFIGRQVDMKQLSSELLIGSSHIININGPPAYGKSSLAIHIGHEMVSNGINVRYIDVTEHYLFLSNSLHSSFLQSDKAVQHYNHFTLAQYRESLSLASKKSNEVMYSIFADELQEWARRIGKPTILILDNCDDLLHSSDKRKFVYSLKGLVKLAHYNLKIIITSQKHVWLLDDFFRWRVAELPHLVAVQLLRKMHPGVSADNDTISRLVSAVGHCPLAIKVIGSLLNEARVSLLSLLEELEKNPIGTISEGLEEVDKFEYIMSVAYGHLTKETKECAHYLSYFPGSFEQVAGEVILKRVNPTSTLGEKCISALVRQSLLDEFLYGSKHTMLIIRIRMYKLVKEYFHQSSTENQDFNIKPELFTNSFRNYFSQYIVNYSNASKYTSHDEMEEYKFLSESHNFAYLYNTLSTSIVETTSEVISLCFALGRGFLISLKNIMLVDVVYHLLLNSTNYGAVCDVLAPTECTKLYSNILQTLHRAHCTEWNCDISHILWSTRGCEIFLCSHVAISLERLSATSYKVENNVLLLREMTLASQLCMITRVLIYALVAFIACIIASAISKTYFWKYFYALLSIMTSYYAFYSVANFSRAILSHEMVCFGLISATIADYILILLVAITTTLAAYICALLDSLYSVCMTMVFFLLLYCILYSFSAVVLSTLILMYFLLPFIILFWVLSDFQSLMWLFITCWIAAIFLPFVTYLCGSPLFDID